MPNNVKNKFFGRYKSRKRLYNLILTRFSLKNWLLQRDVKEQINQLGHDEREALWARINFTLQTFN